MWGLYANMIAQLISQVSSHFIIHYHRNIVHKATKTYKDRHGLIAASTRNLELTEASDNSNESFASNLYGNRRDVLHQHAYARPHRGESGKLIARCYVNGLVLFGSLVFVVLIILGCTLPSSGLEFLGVLGVAVESGQGWRQAVTKLSLFDLVKLLMDQARFVGQARDYLGLGSLSALLIITVLLVPLAQTATLLYQWFVPMAGKRRKRLAIAIEVLQAWQYAEVYIISVVVATWQLGPLSTFMINQYCGSFQETFDLLAYFGILDAGDAQCFRVDASIESAAYILALAAALLALLNTFIMNAVKQYFRDRDEVISREEWKEHMFEQQDDMQTANSTPVKMLEQDKMIKEEQAVVIEKDHNEEEYHIEKEDSSSVVSEDRISLGYWEGRAEAEEYIKPVPVLFTDKFRWLLRRATTTEELNGDTPLTPPIGEMMTEKPPHVESDVSTCDDEQPTSLGPTRMASSIDPDQSVVSSVYLDDSRDASQDNTAATFPTTFKSVGGGVQTW